MTPPGPFRPQPYILTAVPSTLSESPAIQDEDPYGFDESDEEEGQPDPINHGPRSIQDEGRTPEFWGVRNVEGGTTFERDNTL